MFEERSLQFVYLVQGRMDLTLDFMENVGRLPNLLVATWDSPLESQYIEKENTFFIPGTSWAEGRNLLAKKGMDKFPDAKYFIFCDEDVRFKSDFLSAFETKLIEHEPCFAVPLCDRIKSENWFSNRVIDRPIRHDQVLQAFRRDVMEEGIIFPMDTTFDKISWWLTANLQHYLIQVRYLRDSLQFNSLEVSNTHHTLEIQTEDKFESKSKYVHGEFTREDMEKLKKYIESKFGDQGKKLDTIFQSPFNQKYRIVNLNSRHIHKLLQLFRDRNFASGVKFFIKIAFTFSSNVFYLTFLPYQHLLAGNDHSITKFNAKKSRPDSHTFN